MWREKNVQKYRTIKNRCAIYGGKQQKNGIVRRRCAAHSTSLLPGQKLFSFSIVSVMKGTPNLNRSQQVMYIHNKAICPERSLFTERHCNIRCEACQTSHFLAEIRRPTLHYRQNRACLPGGITNIKWPPSWHGKNFVGFKPAAAWPGTLCGV